jgi:hypothetical protein
LRKVIRNVGKAEFLEEVYRKNLSLRRTDGGGCGRDG